MPTVCCQPPDRAELLSVITTCRAEAKISAQVNSNRSLGRRIRGPRADYRTCAERRNEDKATAICQNRKRLLNEKERRADQNLSAQVASKTAGNPPACAHVLLSNAIVPQQHGPESSDR